MEFIVPVWLYRRGDGEQPRSTDAHATAATPLRKLPWLRVIQPRSRVSSDA